MTAQVPDAIENMHPDVHFGDLKLYALAGVKFVRTVAGARTTSFPWIQRPASP
jgi:hypothetical protein